MQSVSSNAVYKSLNPSTTTIIESTLKRTVSLIQGQTTWWGMTNYPAPNVPQGKRLIRRFAKCSNENIAVAVVNYGHEGKSGILTSSDETKTVDIWFCIEVADL